MAYNTREYITDITRNLKCQLGQRLSFHTGPEIFEKNEDSYFDLLGCNNNLSGISQPRMS